MSIELKPCPFCGSTATLNATGLANFTYQVVCDGCFAATGLCKNDEKIIEQWNTRHEFHIAPATEQPVELCDNETIAKVIYEAMRWAIAKAPYHGGGTPPAWTDGGNSYAQDHAREAARNVSGSSIRREAVIQWHPIETAPKDKTILAICEGENGPFIMAVWWQEDVWYTGWVSGGHRSDYEDRYVTQWMPLPEIPRRG